MRLTVLGSNGTYGTPGRPTSGYLLDHGATRIWVDAGVGTFAQLQAVTDFVSLDAIVLSHVHADHCLDILGFYHAVRYGARPRQGVPVYCPTGLAERLVGFLGAVEHPITETCDFRVMDGGDRVEVGELELGFAVTDHPVPTLATRVIADGRSLVYTADTGTGGDWAELASGADLLLAEATYQGSSEDKPWAHHLTAAEAGAAARQAEVGGLMLTHLWPTLDPDRSVAEAEESFGRPVRLAVPGLATSI